MKTTIELPDPLFESAKALARRRGTTLRAVVEEGLRTVLRESRQPSATAFKLVDASVPGGELLQPDPARWRELEDEHLAAGPGRSRRR